jgi:hypothetical protein
LPRAFVQPGDPLQQTDPIAVFEIEQRVETPVQVIGEVRDLLPDLVDRVPS